MDEAKLMDGFYCKGDLCHVESCNVFSEDFVFDEHSHQITAWQELHKHVQECAVLKGSVKLDDPRAVGLGENVTF